MIEKRFVFVFLFVGVCLLREGVFNFFEFLIVLYCAGSHFYVVSLVCNFNLTSILSFLFNDV